MPLLLPEFIQAVQAYKPGDSVNNILASRTIVPIIGPTSVGKSIIIDLVSEKDYNCARVIPFTTRPRRRGDTEENYRYLRHNAETLAGISHKMLSRKLVQVAIHPTTHFLYGSDPEDYTQAFNLIGLLASEVNTIRALGFKQCIPIAIATEPKNWQNWFMKRFKDDGHVADAVKRLAEAQASLEWSLNDPDVIWVHNRQDHPEKTAKHIIDILHGNAAPEPEARPLGEAMLAQIPAIAAELAKSL